MVVIISEHMVVINIGSGNICRYLIDICHTKLNFWIGTLCEVI